MKGLEMVPEFGKVVFFNKEKNWGRILPDNPPETDGDKTIFFHRNSGRDITTEGIRGLDFMWGDGIKGDPKAGDRVVFLSTNHRKGPIAFQWNFEDNWKRAEHFLGLRPWPWCPLCRIVRQDIGGKKEVLWRGYYIILCSELSGGAQDFADTFLSEGDRWYGNVWVETLTLQGYQRMWDPLEYPPNKYNITPEEREHLAKFQVV